MAELIKNSELTAMARQSLKGKWLMSAGILLALAAINFIITLGLNIISPLAPYVRGIEALIETFLSIFFFLLIFKIARYGASCTDCSNEVLRKFGSFVWSGIMYGVMVFLWTLLLIIPGIIAQYSYSMVFYIIADEPAMPVCDALKLSRKMMKGNRWKLFCLNCRFIGWILLSLLTLGIGFLFVIPYIINANVQFYQNVKAKYESENGIIEATDYQGMSTASTVLTAILIFVWHAGIVYCISCTGRAI